MAVETFFRATSCPRTNEESLKSFQPSYFGETISQGGRNEDREAAAAGVASCESELLIVPRRRGYEQFTKQRSLGFLSNLLRCRVSPFERRATYERSALDSMEPT
jgi:hypothetical protein